MHLHIRYIILLCMENIYIFNTYIYIHLYIYYIYILYIYCLVLASKTISPPIPWVGLLQEKHRSRRRSRPVPQVAIAPYSPCAAQIAWSVAFPSMNWEHMLRTLQYISWRCVVFQFLLVSVCLGGAKLRIEDWDEYMKMWEKIEKHKSRGRILSLICSKATRGNYLASVQVLLVKGPTRWSLSKVGGLGYRRVKVVNCYPWKLKSTLFFFP